MLVTILADAYKLHHRMQYPKGTEYVYSTWTSRKSRIPYANECVVFGVKNAIMTLNGIFENSFFNRRIDDIKSEYQSFMKRTFFIDNADFDHWELLHKIGHLPIEIKSLPEGSIVPIRCPYLTITNTHPEFFWLTNFLETYLSALLWQPATSATIAYQYRKLLDKYAKETGDESFVQWQGHDFSFRGMSSLGSAISSGMGHLLSFTGTDTIPAIQTVEDLYGKQSDIIGSSVPASEHSVMCSYGNDEESFHRLLTEVHPSGIVSIVSDTWDFFGVLTNLLPKYKDIIMNRDGKCTIRPDSGTPEDIICGIQAQKCESLEDAKNFADDELCEIATQACEGSHRCGKHEYSKIYQVGNTFYEITYAFEYNRHHKTYYYVDSQYLKSCVQIELTPEQKGAIRILWEIFGGTINEKGYKVLDSHIGLIYGDAITYDRCKIICERLKDMGFASTNVVYGIGSFTYQYNTRDSLGFALKSTLVCVNGEWRNIFKNPKTDVDSVKQSQKGRVSVFRDNMGKYTYNDEVSEDAYSDLQTVFKNSKMYAMDESFQDIRKRLYGV